MAAVSQKQLLYLNSLNTIAVQKSRVIVVHTLTLLVKAVRGRISTKAAVYSCGTWQLMPSVAENMINSESVDARRLLTKISL